jgi:hypothetical protein
LKPAPFSLNHGPLVVIECKDLEPRYAHASSSSGRFQSSPSAVSLRSAVSETLSAGLSANIVPIAAREGARFAGSPQDRALEGKAKGPRSGATINEPPHRLSASALGHHLRSTTNQQQMSVARTIGVLDSRFCGLRTHPRDRTLLRPSPQLSPTSTRPVRHRPGRRHRPSFLRWSP